VLTGDQLRVMAVEAHTRHRAQQNMGELAEILAAVQDIDPRRLLEIGVGEGGTLWAWAQLGIPQVLAVTAPVPGPEWVKHNGADLLFASSHSPQALEWVTGRLAGELLDVLYIDGDHTYEGCMADWVDYHPLVRPGGLVIFHDIYFGMFPGVGQVWDEVSAGRQAYVIHAHSGDERPGAGIITIERTEPS
jgi:cephalosporin hydroxylase